MVLPPLNFSINDLPSLEIMVGKESELNWEARDRILASLLNYCLSTRTALSYSISGMNTNFSGSFADLRASFLSLPANDPRFVLSGWIKGNYEDVLLILHTPRTQLCIRACQFVAAFAHFLGPGLFDSFAESTLFHLLKLCGSTKKIIGNAAAESMRSIFQLIIPQRASGVLLNAAQDKNVNVRSRAFECLKLLSERAYEDSSTAVSSCSMHQKLWETLVEKVLQRGVGDANAEIRALAVSVFLIYREKTPENTQSFMDKLDPSTKKQLTLILSKSSAPNSSSTSTTPNYQKPTGVSASLNIRKLISKDEKCTNNSNNNNNSPIPTRSQSPLISFSHNSSSSIKKEKEKEKEKEKLLSPSKSVVNLPKMSFSKEEFVSPSPSRLSPSKSSSNILTLSPSKLFPTLGNNKPLPQASTPVIPLSFEDLDVPMDEISVRPQLGSPMKVEKERFLNTKEEQEQEQDTEYPNTTTTTTTTTNTNTNTNIQEDLDFFMDAQSTGGELKVDFELMNDTGTDTDNLIEIKDQNLDDEEAEDSEIFFNIPNVKKSSNRSSPNYKNNSVSASGLLFDAQSSRSLEFLCFESHEDVNININRDNQEDVESLEELSISMDKDVNENAHDGIVYKEDLDIQPQSTPIKNYNSTTTSSPFSKLKHSLSTPLIPDRIKSLGLASSTPLRRLYYNNSMDLNNSNNNNTTTPPINTTNSTTRIHNFNFNQSHSNSLVNDLIEEFAITKSPETFIKISSLIRCSPSEALKFTTSNLVQKLFLYAPINYTAAVLELMEVVLNENAGLLFNSLKEIIFIFETISDNIIVENDSSDHSNYRMTSLRLIDKICNSTLNYYLSPILIDLLHVKISEFRFHFLAKAFKCGNSLNLHEFILKSIPPLLLALNHPNPTMRKSGISCILEGRNGVIGVTNCNKDQSNAQIMELLVKSKAGEVQKRIIEDFLRDF